MQPNGFGEGEAEIHDLLFGATPGARRRRGGGIGLARVEGAAGAATSSLQIGLSVKTEKQESERKDLFMERTGEAGSKSMTAQNATVTKTFADQHRSCSAAAKS
jgi:hypothetical protein